MLDHTKPPEYVSPYFNDELNIEWDIFFVEQEEEDWSLDNSPAFSLQSEQLQDSSQFWDSL